MKRFRYMSVTAMVVALVIVSAVASAEVVLQIALVDRMEHRAAYQELFRRFEEQNPDIKVEILSLPGGSLRDERLTVMFAGGQMPDIWGEGGATATYHLMNWLLDLSPYVERDRDELQIDDFLPTAWANVVRGDDIIGLPWGTSISTFAYNRDLFDRAGLPYLPVSWTDPSWNYESMLQHAGRLTQSNANGLVEVFGFDQWVWEDYLLTWTQMFGGDWFDAASYESGVVDKVVINTPEARDAYESLYQMMHETVVMPAPTGAPWASQPAHWEPFASGNVAMRITSGWAYSMYIDSAIDWALAAIPQFPAGRQGLVANDAWHISSTTKHPEEAWKLLKFLSSPESIEYFTEQTLFGPARISALPPYAEYLAEELDMVAADVIDVLVGAQTYGVESQDHVFHGWAQLRTVPAEVLGRVWQGTTPVPSALEEAQRRLQGVADQLRAELGM